jgi:hypothetical protein
MGWVQGKVSTIDAGWTETTFITPQALTVTLNHSVRARLCGRRAVCGIDDVTHIVDMTALHARHTACTARSSVSVSSHAKIMRKSSCGRRWITDTDAAMPLTAITLLSDSILHPVERQPVPTQQEIWSTVLRGTRVFGCGVYGAPSAEWTRLQCTTRQACPSFCAGVVQTQSAHHSTTGSTIII